MTSKPSKILIDGRFIGVGDSLSRYTLEVFLGILKMDNINHYTLLIRPSGEKIAKDFLKNYLKNISIKILDAPHYSFAEQTTLLFWLNKKKFDLVHFTQFNHPVFFRGKFVVTVHDLTLLGHLYRKNFLQQLGFRAVMASAIKKSKAIIAISKTTKDDIVETYCVNPNKIFVTHLGVDDKYSTKARQLDRIQLFKNRYGIVGDYILYTGMWKKHKNLIRMLKAFEKIKLQDTRCKIPARSCYSVAGGQTKSNTQTTNLQLVLVGKIDKNEPEVLREIERINRGATKIVATGFIDECNLPTAYAGATCYCIPSLSEGFGLPPLEAMACGTPVISSNISAMPEILGNAPLYFDPYSVNDIAEKMARVISDKKLQEELSKNGLKHAQKYRWQVTSEKTFEIYQENLG